jgi:UDP-glucose 4-epimerase
MPYCLSCRNHFQTIEEMQTIDCNRMGLCKECGNVAKVKSIMITGLEEGYIASNLKAYAKNRAGIHVYQNYKGMFRDSNIFGAEIPDAVIHLAAISGVGACEKDPKWALHVNVVGTINVVEACKKLGIPVWLASSFAAIQPENFYGYTKAMAEYVTLQYELGRVFVISNVYGGLNFEKKTSILAQWKKYSDANLPIVINGHGQQERDFIHVQDVVRTMVDQVNVEIRGGPSYPKYYICSGVKTSVNELATLFYDKFPKSNLGVQRYPDVDVGIKTPYITAPMPHCVPRISLREGIRRLRTGYADYDVGL